MAKSIVAGAAALIKAENHDFTPADIESIITDGADKYRDMSSVVQDGNYKPQKCNDTGTTYQLVPPAPTPTPT